jgi:hypothetical protein
MSAEIDDLMLLSLFVIAVAYTPNDKFKTRCTAGRSCKLLYMGAVNRTAAAKISAILLRRRSGPGTAFEYVVLWTSDEHGSVVCVHHACSTCKYMLYTALHACTLAGV